MNFTTFAWFIFHIGSIYLIYKTTYMFDGWAVLNQLKATDTDYFIGLSLWLLAILMIGADFLTIVLNYVWMTRRDEIVI
jgi:hypothetical protein